MIEKQLELDLGDKFMKFERITQRLIDQHRHNYNTSVRIFKEYYPQYYIGLRTFLYEVDITYLHEIDEEVAVYLLENLDITDYMGWYSDYKKNKKVAE